MKKAIIIITLLILLIGICICEEVVLKDLSSKIESISTSLYNNISINENINDNDEIKNEYNQLNNLWLSKKNVICIFANYEKIKTVDECVHKLEAAIETNDKSLAIENVSTIKAYTHFINYFMGFNINNLF